MTITININGLSLCHRGNAGLTRNTLPDVCKTPSKGVPLPYSNTAYSRDLSKGTSTVFADGGNMIANNGSIFARSTGDEGGSMGGIKSGTHLAEAEWMTHSFDVFFERKAACRLSDKMFMNHRNTVSMSGHKVQPLKGHQQQVQDWVCECQKDVKLTKDDGSKKSCTELGNERHDCMEKKKADQNAADAKEGKPAKHGGEKGYKTKEGKIEQVDDIGQRRADNPAKLERAHKEAVKQQRIQERNVSNARSMQRTMKQFKAARRGLDVDEALADIIMAGHTQRALEALEKADKDVASIEKALQKPNDVHRHKDHTYPDGSVSGPDGKVRELSEYKFICDKDHPTYRRKDGSEGPASKGDSVGPWANGQEDKYVKLLQAMKGSGIADSQAEVRKYSAADCRDKKSEQATRKSSGPTTPKKRK